MPVLAAIDCDLHRIHAVRGDGTVIGTSMRNLNALIVDLSGKTGDVLFEVASALDYTDNKAIAHQKRRWTIWNIAQAQSLHQWCHGCGIRVLVSPSHDWTLGHPLSVRHKLAKANAPNKDLREAQAMLWFHAHAPEKWRPFPDFLDHL